ncbi:hypothetical protein PPYR_15165 [Photinus pyralis]|uniref:Regulatory protein zeste n=2 Tax=Photinus pyralis TaxID=7054 RepID=A0A5N3ZZF3_PHOPY|nr:hypothetical protein PPYR_15165 [Photinus pyralis]
MNGMKMNENEAKRVRERSANFTADEKILLLNLISKLKSVIECKKTDQITSKEKDLAWDNIQNEFQMCSKVYRTKESIKKFYENKKRDTRKAAAADRAEKFKTGGGQIEDTLKFSDPTLELTMAIMNKKSVSGLHNPFDDDLSEENVNVGDALNLNNDELLFVFEEDKEMAEQSPPSTPNETPVSSTRKRIHEKDDWASYKAVDLKKQTSCKLRQPKANWTSRRRPVVTESGNLALQYEKLAEVKAEIANEQLTSIKEEKTERGLKLEILKLEKEQKLLKFKQLKEEIELKNQSFQLDIQSKQLDIEIKKLQLEYFSKKAT